MSRSSTKRFQDSVLDLLWRQWGLLGVQAAGAAARPPREGFEGSLDLEALLIASLFIFRKDARLFDETCDGVRKNRHLVSAQRLNNLVARFPAPAERLVSAVMEAAGVRSTRSTRPISGDLPLDLTPLFLDAPAGDLRGQTDPIFARHGFARPPLRFSGKSNPPSLTRPACLNLRLRSIFGPGSRAEVTSYLLLKQGELAPTATIAQAAAFDRRNVLEVLTQLQAAGMVERVAGRGEHAWAIDPAAWGAWLGLEVHRARYFDWQNALCGLVLIWQHLDDPSLDHLSPYAYASKARDVMDRSAPMLASFPGWKRANPLEYPGAAYREAFERDLENLVTDHLETH